MRIDPDTSIHDLTDAEAADLRALCEAIMRGPTPMDHPLFVAWSKASGLDDRQSLLAFTTAFLPRALHALLRRADAVLLREATAVNEACNDLGRIEISVAPKDPVGGALVSGPYRSPPAAPVRAPRASRWRNVERIMIAGRPRRRPWLRIVPYVLGIVAWALFFRTWTGPLASFCACATGAAIGLSWHLLLGRLRLHRVRRAMRPKSNATATTFPAIAAYRELARTGDVAAFAAKDLRPVTAEYTLQAMDYAEAARAIVITPPDAAIKATVIVLTDDERRGLTTNLDELGAVK